MTFSVFVLSTCVMLPFVVTFVIGGLMLNVYILFTLLRYGIYVAKGTAVVHFKLVLIKKKRCHNHHNHTSHVFYTIIVNI